jgi:predicted Zn-dependent peptidase
VSSYNPHSDIVTAEFVINAGARYEDSNEYGLAHTLEHLFLKGSHNHPYDDLIKMTDYWGAYLNASTNKEDIKFTFQTINGGFDFFMSVISDAIKNPIINSVVLENEKKIIGEERRTLLDNPTGLLWKTTFETVFKNADLAHFIAGEEDSVKKFSRDDLLEYVNKKISPSRMTLFVSGGVDNAVVFQNAEKYFSGLNGKETLIMSGFQYEKKKHFLSLSKTQTYYGFVLGIGSPTLRELVSVELIINLLANGRNSILYKKLRSEKGLVYTVNGGRFIFRGGSLIYVQTVSSNPEWVEDNFLTTVNNLKNSFTEATLNDQKERKINNLLRTISYPEKELSILSEYSHIDGSIVAPNELIAMIKKINLKDLEAVAEKLIPDDFSVIRVGK